jgi:hypothetical protein
MSKRVIIDESDEVFDHMIDFLILFEDLSEGDIEDLSLDQPLKKERRPSRCQICHQYRYNTNVPLNKLSPTQREEAQHVCPERHCLSLKTCPTNWEVVSCIKFLCLLVVSETSQCSQTEKETQKGSKQKGRGKGKEARSVKLSCLLIHLTFQILEMKNALEGEFLKMKLKPGFKKGADPQDWEDDLTDLKDGLRYMTYNITSFSFIDFIEKQLPK